MAAHKGHKKAGGRAKGTPNKLTVGVKQALGLAFAELGGVADLVKWAKDNPTEFYKLWARLLPQEVKQEHSGPEGGPIPHAVTVAVSATAEDVALAEAILAGAARPVHPNGGPKPVAAAPQAAPQAAVVPPARRRA